MSFGNAVARVFRRGGFSAGDAQTFRFCQNETNRKINAAGHVHELKGLRNGAIEPWKNAYTI